MRDPRIADPRERGIDAHLEKSTMQQINRLIVFLLGMTIFHYGHGQDMNVCFTNLHKSIEKMAIIYYSDSLVIETYIDSSDFIIPEHMIIDADSVIISLRTMKGQEYSFQLVSKLMACRNVRYSFEDPRLRRRLTFRGDYCGEQSTIGHLDRSGSKPSATPRSR
jgi:hypothetical protein